jgi:hypothetical protein
MLVLEENRELRELGRPAGWKHEGEECFCIVQEFLRHHLRIDPQEFALSVVADDPVD